MMKLLAATAMLTLFVNPSPSDLKHEAIAYICGYGDGLGDAAHRINRHFKVAPEDYTDCVRAKKAAHDIGWTEPAGR